MNNQDPFSRMLKAWQPKNPHALPKFVNDTMREIRLLDSRPWWKVWMDGCSERLDELTAEWLPSPRALAPVAAALILLVTAVQWARVERDADQIVALKWQQSISEPVQEATLSGAYSKLVVE